MLSAASGPQRWWKPFLSPTQTPAASSSLYLLQQPISKETFIRGPSSFYTSPLTSALKPMFPLNSSVSWFRPACVTTSTPDLPRSAAMMRWFVKIDLGWQRLPWKAQCRGKVHDRDRITQLRVFDVQAAEHADKPAVPPRRRHSSVSWGARGSDASPSQVRKRSALTLLKNVLGVERHPRWRHGNGHALFSRVLSTCVISTHGSEPSSLNDNTHFLDFHAS